VIHDEGMGEYWMEFLKGHQTVKRIGFYSAGEVIAGKDGGAEMLLCLKLMGGTKLERVECVNWVEDELKKEEWVFVKKESEEWKMCENGRCEKGRKMIRRQIE
jgi:hypothetical protein